jgi:hypothetical protein
MSHPATPVTVVANGSTGSFNSSTIGTIYDIKASNRAGTIDRTNLGSSTMVFDAELPKPDVSFLCVGFDNSVEIGTKGALAFTPHGGSSEDFGVSDWVYLGADFEGITVNGRMASTLNFAPTEIEGS